MDIVKDQLPDIPTSHGLAEPALVIQPCIAGLAGY